MKAREKWDQWKSYIEQARLQYDRHGEDSYYCWFYLLLAAEVVWTHPGSKKQQQQRKLASQLWRLTGIYGQMRQLTYEIRDRDSLKAAMYHIAGLVESAKYQMKHIK